MDLFYWRISIHLNRQAELFKTLCLHFYLCCHDNVVHQVCPNLQLYRVWKGYGKQAYIALYFIFFNYGFSGLWGTRLCPQ